MEHPDGFAPDALSQGLAPGALKPGDPVSVVIHPTRAGSRAGQFLSGTGPDGKPLREG